MRQFDAGVYTRRGECRRTLAETIYVYSCTSNTCQSGIRGLRAERNYYTYLWPPDSSRSSIPMFLADISVRFIKEAQSDISHIQYEVVARYRVVLPKRTELECTRDVGIKLPYSRDSDPEAKDNCDICQCINVYRLHLLYMRIHY